MSFDEKRTRGATDLSAGGFDRRLFLKLLGTAFSTAALPEALSDCALDGATEERFSVDDVESLVATRTINVVRPEDLLVLSIGLVNLRRSPAGSLIKAAAGPAFLILDFPPQALLEDAATLTSTDGNIAHSMFPSDFFAVAKLGGTTRLVFQLPEPYTPVSYSLSGMLGLCGNSSVVVAQPMQNTVATIPLPPSDPTVGNGLVDRTLAAILGDVDIAASARTLAFTNKLPTGLQPYQGATPQNIAGKSVSQIEIPYRLQMSPNSLAGWSHATAPVQGSSKAYEIWHTVLGVRSVAADGTVSVDERNAYLRTGRALWTRDTDLGATDPAPPPAPQPTQANPPVESELTVNPSLKVAQRQRIVALSSQGSNATPIQINRLMLSSLGGYFDARADFNDPTHLVDRWIHKMTGGRENFVQVDQGGYVLPFGNLATRVQITKRNDDPNRGPVGTMYAFDVIIIGNPITSYRSADVKLATRNALLQWPFVSVELKQRQFITQPMPGGDSYWPLDLSGSPIMVPAVGYDRRGRATSFEVPLYFVLLAAKTPTAEDTRYRTALANPPWAAPRTARPASIAGPDGNSLNVMMGGQRLAYADSKKDDTTFPTRSLAFDVTPVASETIRYIPTLTSAVVDIDSLHSYVKHGPDGAPLPTTVFYHLNFLANKLKADGTPVNPKANASQLLFKLKDSVKADFTTDHATGGNRTDCGTGFVAPNMLFNALSRTTGPSYDGSQAAGAPGNALLMSGNAPFEDGKFDPSQYLGLATKELEKLKIFGVFSLLDIIRAVDGPQADADIKGLADKAEQAALKYAPKFIAQGLSDLEHIISMIAEVKSQIELLYTNAKELIGDAYALAPNGATAAITGTLATAKNMVVDGVAKTEAEIEAVKAEIAGKIKDIVEKAKAFYKSLEGALAHIEALDPLPLAGDANVDGSIVQIVTRGVALEQAVTDLAKYGARAAVQAQQVAVNAGNAVRTANLVRVQRLQVTDAIQTADQVTNAALQIATGIQETFSKKLKQLTDILSTVGDIAKLFHNAQQALDTLRDMTVKIEWQPKIGSYVLPDLNWTIFRPASQHALTLLLEARAKATPNKSAGVDISCRLDHFDLCLGPLDADQKPVVGLQFDHISFAMEAGKKPDVDVKINGIVFGGPLAFLETLRRIIPLDGFSDPPYLKVDVAGIHAGFSLSVPNIAVGIFSIENIAISAKLEIPFFSSSDGPAAALTFTFSFCDKDHPFIITVSLLGGGGYFVVSFTPKGLEMLEASICVGAQLAINLFEIAQGSISIMAGITFTIKEGDVSLTAFLRIHGELDILGIITISVDISVSITYDITHKMMVAEAKIKVDVSIVFFSINVELPFRKEFHSCNNDPTLRQLMPPGPDNIPSEFWNDYCAAYA